MAESLAYRRVLLKFSGEALGGPGQTGLDPQALAYAADEITGLHRAGAALALVTGGGNILRGALAAADGFERAVADEMGMIATVINGLALSQALQARQVPVRLFTALPAGRAARPYRRESALEALANGEAVILAGGTGNPFLTTDTAAALRAAELGAEVIFKGTKVDGVYESDPVGGGGGQRFAELSYADFLSGRFGVMDQTAVTLCREREIPLVVFDFFRPGNLLQAARGAAIGTCIGKGAP